MLSVAALRDFFCGLQGCRVSDWKLAAHASWCGRVLDSATERAKRLVSVEKLDVFGLRNGQTAHRPGEVDEMWLARGTQGMHATFFGKVIPLAGIARATGSDHVAPLVIAPAGEWNQ